MAQSTTYAADEAAPSQRTIPPPKWETTVRTVQRSESRLAGMTLAHAFADDALCLAFLGNESDTAAMSDEERWKLHVRVMTSWTSYHYHGGVVTTIGPDFEAVALWSLPGKPEGSWWDMVRSGMWRLNYQLPKAGRGRLFDDLLPFLYSTMDEVMGTREFYYLAFIGTKPRARRKGYASRLLQDKIARADAEKRAIYLEATSLDNVRYYEHFSFVIKKEIEFHCESAPLPLYIMVREPQPDRSRSDSSVFLDEVAAAKA